MATPYRRGKRRTYTRRRVGARVSVRRRASMRRRPSVRSQRRTHVCSTMSPSAKFALAQLDPFDNSALGAKIPDSNTMPSLSNHDTDILSVLGPVALGELSAYAFRPQYTQAVITATFGGGSIQWGATYGSNATNRQKRSNYLSAIELTRPVAHAIRLSSPVSPTTASGFVHIGLATETNYLNASWTFPTNVSEMSGLQHYKRVTLASLTQSPLTVINKWLDDTGFRYSAPSSGLVLGGDATFQTDYGWGVIVVICEGTPVSAQVLSVEHLLVSEGIPQKSGVIIGSVAAPNSPGTMSAVGTMSTEQTPFHTEAEQDSYIQRGVDAIARGAAAAGEQVYSNVAIPLLERVGSFGAATAAQMAYNALTGVGGLPGVNANAGRLALNR